MDSTNFMVLLELIKKKNGPTGWSAIKNRERTVINIGGLMITTRDNEAPSEIHVVDQQYDTLFVGCWFDFLWSYTSHYLYSLYIPSGDSAVHSWTRPSRKFVSFPSNSCDFSYFFWTFNSKSGDVPRLWSVSQRVSWTIHVAMGILQITRQAEEDPPGPQGRPGKSGPSERWQVAGWNNQPTSRW